MGSMACAGNPSGFMAAWGLSLLVSEMQAASLAIGIVCSNVRGRHAAWLWSAAWFVCVDSMAFGMGTRCGNYVVVHAWKMRVLVGVRRCQKKQEYSGMFLV